MESIINALLGGALVGLSTFAVLFFQARVAGISGIAASLFDPTRGDIGWRVAFIVGMVGSGTLIAVWRPELFGAPVRSIAVLLVAGFLVGLGTRTANGCTSGHGVCGLSRASRRSLFATLTFMGVGALTVLLNHTVTGGS